MIFIGLTDPEKNTRIMNYCESHAIDKVFILSPKKFYFDCEFENSEVIEYADIIEYRYFYRLLQEINSSTLIVINECLRTQNRYDLTYNCIRHFLNQAKHQLIFQWLPLIDDIQDFMILFDFDTRSRWKREKFDIDLLENCRIEIQPKRIELNRIDVTTDATLKNAYQREKTKLVDGIGIKDPHTIPRNLYLMSGKARMQRVVIGEHYIGRNDRFKIGMQTYKESAYQDTPYTVFEFPHNFIDFADFVALSKQTVFNVLVAGLKVDDWYFDRYNQWTKRLNDGYANLS
ncbi:MAG: hypothetical protein WC856_13790 [Methylococcaceae bacterium]|jgi:hypothetical protein